MRKKRKKRTRNSSTKAEYYRDIMEIDAIVPSLAKETEGSLTMSIDKTHSNRRSKKNKCSYDKPKLMGRAYI